MLRGLAPSAGGDLIIGPDDGDDAAVWRLDDRRLLVATVDFITPLVDDAATWGRIAATNAVSDVYAMGARPLFGLNIVGWNHDELSTELLQEVMEGATAVAEEGGWVVAGGHTVDDPEPKFGLAVIGEAEPGRLLRLDGLRAGDALVLTKPLGTGIVATALKAGAIGPSGDGAGVLEAAVAEMVRTNAAASRVAREAGATGAVDVTGFGLLGHLRRQLEASDLAAELDVQAVPLLEGARPLAEAGHVPGGSRRNLAWVREFISGAGGVDETTLTLLADAQTSGGLLFGADPQAAEQAVAELAAGGHTAAVVGRAVAGRPGVALR